MDRDLQTGAAARGAGLASEWAFLAVSALLFAASAGVVVYVSRSMSGGGIQSGVWTPAAGQSWIGAAAVFWGTWIVMMAAMMLPSLAPALLRLRRSLRAAGGKRLAGLTALAGAGYFLVWAVFGAAVFPFGAALTALEMQSMDLARLAPFATGAALLLAGVFQLTALKARQLVHCRYAPTWSRPPGGRSAWVYGLRLGVHCCLCCAGFMLVLLATGVMDLGGMALVAAAITFERLAPLPVRVARLLGVLILGLGVLMLVRAVAV